MTAIVVRLPTAAAIASVQPKRRLPTSVTKLSDVRCRRHQAAQRAGQIAELQGYLAGMRRFAEGQRRELALTDHELCIKRRAQLITALEHGALDDAKLAAELAALQADLVALQAVRKP